MCLRWLFLLSTFLVSPVVNADERRVAVVIGVGDYRAVPGVGSRGRRFGASARGADVVLFYYAGHAVESGGSNWLLPISADIRAGRDLRFEATDLDGVLEQFEGVARLAIVVLDACRDNPFRSRLADGSRGIDASRGLIRVQAPVGTLVVFSTAPGTVAADGTGPNSPFTAALLKRIETPGLEIRQMLAEVRRDVRQATQGKQVPWEQSAMEGALYLKPTPSAPASPANVPAAPPVASARPGLEAESLFWDSVRNSANSSDLRAYLSRFPDGLFVDLAKTRLAALGDGAAKPPATPNGSSLAARLIERMSPLPMAERESVAPCVCRRGASRRSRFPPIEAERIEAAPGPPPPWLRKRRWRAARPHMEARVSCWRRTTRYCRRNERGRGHGGTCRAPSMPGSTIRP